MILSQQGEDESRGAGGEVIDMAPGERADDECEEERGEEGGVC